MRALSGRVTEYGAGSARNVHATIQDANEPASLAGSFPGTRELRVVDPVADVPEAALGRAQVVAVDIQRSMVAPSARIIQKLSLK